MSEFIGSKVLQMRISKAGGQLIKSQFTSAGLLLPQDVSAPFLLPRSLGWGWVGLALWKRTKCTFQCFQSSLSATKICSCSRDYEVGLGQGLVRSEIVLILQNYSDLHANQEDYKGEGKNKKGRRDMKKPVFSPLFLKWSGFTKVTDMTYEWDHTETTMTGNLR